MRYASPLLLLLLEVGQVGWVATRATGVGSVWVLAQCRELQQEAGGSCSQVQQGQKRASLCEAVGQLYREGHGCDIIQADIFMWAPHISTRDCKP